MSENTSISWTHHTFNSWWGCVKVSPGCANCYADTFSRRTGNDLWGVDKPRRFFGDKHWNEPLAWNAAAEAAGERRRVFCASMADWLEDRDDLIAPRARLLRLIYDTPHLDWLLLSKRPENWSAAMQRAYEVLEGEACRATLAWINGEPPANVWVGTTVENQEYTDKRIPALLRIPARVRFLSVEPMLGPVDLGASLGHWTHADGSSLWMSRAAGTLFHPAIHWVICGGESGGKRRPFEVEWAQSLADQCSAAGVAFHMKQDAAFKSGEQGRIPDALWNRKEFPKTMNTPAPTATLQEVREAFAAAFAPLEPSALARALDAASPAQKDRALRSLIAGMRRRLREERRAIAVFREAKFPVHVTPADLLKKAQDRADILEADLVAVQHQLEAQIV